MKKSGLRDSPLFSKMSGLEKQPKKDKVQKAVSKKKESTRIYSSELIESIRKDVRDIGKEATTHRLSIKERKALLEIVYNLRMNDIRITENEITRIALNFLIRDYTDRKHNSLLASMIDVLND
ncbi:MAG: hypothetical protein ACTSQ8_24600 [Candidatus Helarchaeota archaeon]